MRYNWKKYLVLLILPFFIFGFNVNAEELHDLTQYRTEENKIIGEPYLNPKWIEWNNLSKEEKSKWDVIPKKLIVDFIYEEETENYYLNRFNASSGDDRLKPKAQSLPTSYSLKTEGYMSPVKNQSSLGLCWAFASVGAVESNALKTLGKSLIFSERQIDYAVSDPSASIIEGYNPYGDSSQVLGNGGGWFSLAADVFQSGISPVLTSEWGNYTTSLAKKSLSSIINTENVEYQVTDTVDFPYINIETASESEKEAYRDMIKKHIMSYGGVYVSTIIPDTRSGSCYNSAYNMIYETEVCTYNEENPFHAMLIIGWNDTYGPDYDGDGVGDGAWILKNSWGTQNQYPYLSYNSIGVEFSGIISIKEKDWDRNYDETDLGTITSSTRTYYKDETTDEYLKRITFYNQYSYKNNVYNVYVSQTGNVNDKTFIGSIITNNPGIYSIDVNDIMLNSDLFKIYIENEITNRYAKEINAFTSRGSISSDKKIITIVKDNYVSYDSSISTNSFELYSITENIETGQKLTYKIYNSTKNDVTPLFTISDSYVINNNQKATLNFNTSDINMGIYTVETYLNGNLLNTNEFEIGNIRIESLEMPNSNYYFENIVGETGKISPLISPKNAYNKVLIYESENSNIVAVDSDGNYEAISVGKTKIKISTTDGSNITISVTIHVMKALEGEGTEENPYKIYNKYDLNKIRYSTSSYYELKNDIEFYDSDYEIGEAFYNNGRFWLPISSFSGVLEGNGYTIKNLKIRDEYTESNGRLGMFEILSNAIIKNITFSDSTLINNNLYDKTSIYYNGLLAGKSFQSTISNVSILDSNISDIDDYQHNSYYGGSYTGSLLGTSEYDDIIDCSSNSVVVSKYAGGLIGSASYSFIYGSFSEANLTAPNMGGLAYEISNSSIMDSYSISTFNLVDNTRTKYVGGITGISSDSFYWNVYSINIFNNYSDEMDVHLGGISGRVQNKTKMYYTFAKDDKSIINTSNINYESKSGSVDGYGTTLSEEMIKGELDDSGNLLFCKYDNCGLENGNWKKDNNREYITLKGNSLNLNDVKLKIKKGTSISANVLYPLNILYNNGLASLSSSGNKMYYDKSNNMIVSFSNSLGNEEILLSTTAGSTSLSVGNSKSKKIIALIYDVLVEDFDLHAFHYDINGERIDDFDIYPNEEYILYVGEKLKFQPKFLPLNSSVMLLNYNINNDVASLDSSSPVGYNSLTAMAPGVLSLKVSTVDGSYIEKEYKIKIIGRQITLSNLNLNPKTIYNEIGGKVNLTATLENIQSDKVLVDILNEDSEIIITKEFNVIDNIASIELNIPSTVEAGTYTIKVTAGDYSAEETFEVKEYIHVNSVELNKESIELLKGETDETLEVTLNPTDAINKNVAWTSSNESVLTVDQNGKVTAVGRGIATITVTSEDGNKIDTCEVTVIEPKITLGEKTINSNYDNILYAGYGGTVIIPITTQDIEENYKLTLKYYKDEIELTNKEVSDIFKIGGNVVSNNNVNLQIGVMVSAPKGKYKIEVSSENAITKSFDFDVVAPILVSGIEAQDLTLIVNEVKKVNYTITNNNALNKKVTFSIRNKDESLTTLVATIDEEGNITGKHIGEAILTISTCDGSNIKKEILITIIEDFDIKTDKYKIDEKMVISKIKDNLLYEDFIKDFEVNPNISIKIYKNNNEIDYSQPLGTGYKLKTYFNDELKNEYTLSVSGDLNGDGIANVTDVAKLYQHLRGNQIMIEDCYIDAGNLIGDTQEIKLNDVAKLYQYVKGKIGRL